MRLKTPSKQSVRHRRTGRRAYATKTHNDEGTAEWRIDWPGSEIVNKYTPSDFRLDFELVG